MMNKIFKNISNKHSRNKYSSGGGGNNTSNKIKQNPLFKDIKEYNKYLLSLVGILFLVITGVISYNLTNASYAKWSSSVESKNIIKLSVKSGMDATEFATVLNGIKTEFGRSLFTAKAVSTRLELNARDDHQRFKLVKLEEVGDVPFTTINIPNNESEILPIILAPFSPFTSFLFKNSWQCLHLTAETFIISPQ